MAVGIMSAVRIHLAGRRRSAASLAREFPGAVVIDVTSRAEQPWVRLSPFYPHGDIPVPGGPGLTGQSLEGICQARRRRPDDAAFARGSRPASPAG
ncbi:DUF6939 family protein [Nonomuraea terrae]|uniref:DUF6939 family protein n=1 Tax=Nonomuraea terrae TaxID=2530383 RepID=UPI0016529E73|nr:hypothetical protein [Nonomuraea terrae]